jgi:ribosomal protein S18 acetylase RimI-like enzyme
MNKITSQFCDFKNPHHQTLLLTLLDQYMCDPMGNSPSHTRTQQQELIKHLSSHPSVFVLFVLCDNEVVGMAISFINFSTFNVKPYLYIHDLIISKIWRGKGIGHFLLNELISISKTRGYCKITLEVREDNVAAQALYKSVGFMDCNPPMWFWTKKL